MANFLIEGRIKAERGGAFMGISENKPIFGGANIFYACVYWSTTKEEVEKICDKIKARFPNVEAKPKETK